MSHETRVAAENQSLHQAGAIASAVKPSFVGRLARFFPDSTPVRLPVEVTAEAGSSERTTIEYGTCNEVLFSSRLPLEFGERVHVRNADGSLDTDASVVAMQFQNGEIAVAARFVRRVANWIVKI